MITLIYPFDLSNMQDKIINKFFLDCKNSILRHIGRKPMSDVDLTNFGKTLLGSKFKGVLLQDELIDIPGGTAVYIINTDKNNGRGIHWVVVCFTPKHAYVFDSFGRDTKKILSVLYKNIIKHGRDIIEADKDQNQKGSSTVCGQLCLAFLMTTIKYGIKKSIQYI